MKYTTQEELGKIIQYHRKQSGLSRIALAELAGVGKTVVFDLEKGKKNVRLQTLLAILKVLNISLELESPLMAQCSETIRRNNP
jgi:y4mF family transcriptional regulator